jgi:AraC family transcriptional regulator of adaptative response/methylated-DNA-[protein]-cysteine methyltransferase
MVLYSEYDLTMNEQIDLFCTMNLFTNIRETKTEMEMKVDSPTALDEQRYEAIRRREVANGDTFIYAVLSTGVYCRPGCSARTPNRENVVFFDTVQQAEQQGYRPCRKCRPERRRASELREATIIAACRRLEKDADQPSLKTLAAEAGLSPSYFHRLFKKIVGITPRQYYLKHRTDRLRRSLAEGSAVGEAILSAGFEALSTAYNRNDDRLSMTPKRFRQGGRGVRILYGSSSCYLGVVLVAATDRGICAVELGDSEEQVCALLHNQFPRAEIEQGGPGFQRLINAVVDQIDNPSQRFELPLDIQGTSFQQQVWETLRTLGPGSSSSYSEIAELIGKPAAARAVAGACAANKIAFLIPCHRVLTKDKKISGYRWGRERKKLMLDKEKK